MPRFIATHKVTFFFITVAAVGTVLWFTINNHSSDPLEGLTTANVSKGTVAEIVSVSGVTKSERTANLAFPTTGLVTNVLVTEGDTVTASSVLATLGSEQEMATLASAEAELALAQAALSELLAGERSESVAITRTAADNAKAALARTITTEEAAVDHARSVLYSNSLVARPKRSNEDATPPSISGTYKCTKAGIYELRLYTSNSASGYSLTINGLEQGTFPISATQALPFGNCGLYAKINAGVPYHDTTWTIEIPNTSSDTYITNKNALTTAEINAKNAIAAATEAVTLAEKELNLTTAAPRSEAVLQAEARVRQAAAKVNAAKATLADRSIIAPFTGIITDTSIIKGEMAGSEPAITMLESGTFEVVARIPEIDITKITTGQRADIIFDAAITDTFNGIITYVAPLPIEIDGVAYFETKISLTNPPDWLRGGLNADVDIITNKKENTLRVPSRYVYTKDGISSVQTVTATGDLATTTVTITFRGNDGYIAIEGLREGETVVAP